MVAPIYYNLQIDSLKRGQSGRVSHFTNDRMATKLMAMGVVPGSSIKMIRLAPFGGVFYVKVDDIVIALRKQEAGCIVLQPA